MPASKDPTQNKIRDKRKMAFLEEFVRTASVTKACEAVKIDRSTPYEWARRDPVFKEEWNASRWAAAGILEDEAQRRAVEGFEEPVFYRGKKTGHIRRYSDTLLIFLLNGWRPDRYKSRYHNEITGTIKVEDARAEMEAALEQIAERMGNEDDGAN